MSRDELKPMLRLAGPVILAELGWMTMGVVDTIMVGPLGPAAIGAVGVGSSIHFSFVIFGMGLLLGLETLVSHALGAGRLAECRAWLVHGVVLALLLTLPFLGLGFGVLALIPRLGFHPDVAPLLRSYFSIIIWTTPFLLFYAAFRRYLHGMHAVTPVMFALVSANLVNAGANWVLIYGHLGFPALGVAGSAWATLMARVYMVTVLLVAVTRLGPPVAVAGGAEAPPLPVPPAEDIRSGGASAPPGANPALPPPRIRHIDRAHLGRLLRLGFPAASQVALEVGVFAAASALAAKLTPVAVASHQIALNLIAVAFMIPLGLASAGAVRVGYAVGSGDLRRAAGAGWTAILLGVAFMATTAAAFLLVPRWLIGLFTHEEPVLALGTSLLLVAAVFQLFDGVQGVCTGVLRGLGDTRTPMITNFVGHWLFGLPVGYTLCFAAGLGVVGLWIGLSVGLIIVGVILLWIWVLKSHV